MGGFIGPVGGLVEVPFTSSEPEDVPSRSTYRTALSGRVTEQRGPRGRRTWDCSIDVSRPDDHHILDQVSAGMIGKGPYVWYSAMARVTNILTPDQSMMMGGSWSGGAEGGAGVTSDSVRYLGSLTGGLDSVIFIRDAIPVPSEHPLAVSVYVSTHPSKVAWLHVTELDPEGATVGTPWTTSVPADTHAHRAAITITTSPRTVSVRVMVTSALMVTLPSLSITSRPMGWSAGRGCVSASLNLRGSDPRLAFESADGWGRRESRTFTIHELG